MAEDVLRGYRFYCPGCKDYHGVSTNLDLRGPHWRFDGNLERPTFSPSVRVRGGWVYHTTTATSPSIHRSSATSSCSTDESNTCLIAPTP